MGYWGWMQWLEGVLWGEFPVPFVLGEFDEMRSGISPAILWQLFGMCGRQGFQGRVEGWWCRE